jgi:hypothetical protein
MSRCNDCFSSTETSGVSTGGWLGAPRILWEASKGWVTFTGVAFLYLSFNRQLAAWGLSVFGSISPLWGLLPVGLLFVYGMMKANYEELLKLGAVREDTEDSERRRTIKSLLRDLQARGRALAENYNDYQDNSVTDEDLERWRQETYNLIEAAFGKQEAETFLSNEEYPFDERNYLLGWQEHRHDVSFMEARLWHLHKLGREAHMLSGSTSSRKSGLHTAKCRDLRRSTRL